MFCNSISSSLVYSRFAVGILNTGAIYSVARTQPGDPGAVKSSTGILLNSTLYHVAVNVDFVNRFFYFYINGAYDSTAAGDWTAGNTENVDSLGAAIGSRSDKTICFFDGNLDDVRIYNRMLSANELQIIFGCKGSDAIYYGLRARYNMEEKQKGFTTVGGELLRDYAGNFSGTITANCVYADSILKKRRQHQ
jgi:hypothetical protein